MTRMRYLDTEKKGQFGQTLRKTHNYSLVNAPFGSHKTVKIFLPLTSTSETAGNSSSRESAHKVHLDRRGTGRTIWKIYQEKVPHASAVRRCISQHRWYSLSRRCLPHMRHLRGTVCSCSW
jgi:hypothetical protein